jgi:aspartyl-tRNA(Asn)/glutamyl-tRNA(Gln) amidotransferase subunit B
MRRCDQTYKALNSLFQQWHFCIAPYGKIFLIMLYTPVIGLEVHAEMQTHSKMFCGCLVVDSTQAQPNTSVCPVCLGLPGVLPVTNRQAVEYALRVALALGCKVAHTSLFARKNYFYPDLPKGYQISQYEYPLAENGRLPIRTSKGEREVQIRRVHLEEDTGKLTHVQNEKENYSLVDLNRAGVALLEIVSEPDLFSVEEVRAYATSLHILLRYLKVNTGDMSKGVLRFEANVSVHPAGSNELGTRVEIKNLNSFRYLERAVTYQIEQQIQKLERGEKVDQETLGWDDQTGATYSQRSKEEAHDYRYFPEPDLPPLVVEKEWVERVRMDLPELPFAKLKRFENRFGLTERDALNLVDIAGIADYFDECVEVAKEITPGEIAKWMLGGFFTWLNQGGNGIETVKVQPADLIGLIDLVQKGKINQNTAKTILEEMLETGETAKEIVEKHGLEQVSDLETITCMVQQALMDHPSELDGYLNGKEVLSNWFFGQVMRAAGGQADPQVVRAELERQLQAKKASMSNEK